MSEHHTLRAELREDVGKGASRRLRREGRIPAVLYGAGKDPRAVTLEHREVAHAAEAESFFSSILKLKVDDGREQKVVVRDLQRHPFKQQILHLDFLRVSARERLRMSVPLHFVGESKAPASHSSGVVIQHLMNEVDVIAMPKDLPEFIEVDVSALDVGDHIMLSDIVAPEGVELPEQAADDAEETMVVNAVRISESQGSGAAAAAEAEALAEEDGELLAEDEEAAGEDGEEGAGDEAGDGEDADRD